RIFENPALMTHVPDITVAAVNLVRSCGDGNIALFGVRDRVVSGSDVPFPPGRDDFELWRERLVCELEAHLVVSLAGATVGKGVSALCKRYFNLTFREKRPGNGRTEQVLAFIHRSGFHKRPQVLRYEFMAKILDEAFGCARPNRFLLEAMQ